MSRFPLTVQSPGISAQLPENPVVPSVASGCLAQRSPESPGFAPEFRAESDRHPKSAQLNGLPVLPIAAPKGLCGVYFAECDGLIKIGSSWNVAQRMVDLARKRHPLHLLAVGRPMSGIRFLDAEYAIHNALREHHVGGEWFAPSDRLLRIIVDVWSTGRLPQEFDHPSQLRKPGRRVTGRGPQRKRTREERAAARLRPHIVPFDRGSEAHLVVWKYRVAGKPLGLCVECRKLVRADRHGVAQ